MERTLSFYIEYQAYLNLSRGKNYLKMNVFLETGKREKQKPWIKETDKHSGEQNVKNNNQDFSRLGDYISTT